MLDIYNRHRSNLNMLIESSYVNSFFVAVLMFTLFVTNNIRCLNGHDLDRTI